MEEKDFNALVEKLGVKTTELIAEKMDEVRAGLMTEDQLKEAVADFAKSEDIEDINKVIDTKIDEVLVEMKKLQKAEDESKPKTIGEQMKEFHEKFKDSVENHKAFTMHLDTKTTLATTSWGGNTSGTYLPGFNQEAFRGLVFEQFFTRVPLTSGTKTVYYSDQTTVTRNAATRNEAAAAPESALAWTQRSLSMGKILDSIPITHEAMMDINQLTAEVEMFINNNMRLLIDQQMWNGDGSLPNWTGIYTYSTDFTQAIATGALIDDIQDANIYDLIATISTFIANGKQSKYDSNVAFMNPRDILKGRMEKDANGNYIIPPFVSRDGNQVGGTVIVESSAVTANTLSMGDSRHVRFYDVEGIDLEYGLDSDDFTKDLITLKGRKRGNLLLKTLDATAFYKVTDVDQRIQDITA